jgi:molybdate transport system ATP-binding protein
MTLRVHVQKHLGDEATGFSLDAQFVSQGRVTALFGRSGAGKSTLVNLIAGLIRPDKGLIEIDDFCLFDSDRRIDLPAHRRRIGYVFQEGRLFPHLSVRANLLFGRRYTARRRRWGSLEAVVDLLGISALLDRRPAALSGGEKQRVAIGRALLSSPQLLLMDEPLASLDQERKGEILPFIERLRDRMQMPIVYVSHAVDEVSRLADTVVLLEQGKVAAVGSVNDVLGTRIAGYADGTEAGVILTATIVGHDRENGITRLTHPAGDLSVPLVDLPVAAPVRIRIRARDVALAVGDPGRISIRNRLAGVVSAIDEGPAPTVTVRVDIAGDPLLANVTRDAVRDLDLKVGSHVTALVKSAAFDPLSVGRDVAGNRP